MTKADDYLEKLHALVPDFPEAIELLIQINQALKRDVKVELLAARFPRAARQRQGARIDPVALLRARAHSTSTSRTIVISQFFDYTQDPNTVWMAEVFDADGDLKRRILLNYDPDATRALRAKDAKYASDRGLHLVRARDQGRAR